MQARVTGLDRFHFNCISSVQYSCQLNIIITCTYCSFTQHNYFSWKTAFIMFITVPPIINCITTATPSTVTIACEIISYPSINIDMITWTCILNGNIIPVPALSKIAGNHEVLDFRATSTIVINKPDCSLSLLYMISLYSTSFNTTPCSEICEL